MWIKNLRYLASVGLAALAMLAAGDTVLAQGWIEPDTHRFLPGSPVERVRSDVFVTIDAERRIALIEVEEVFRNRAGTMMEGDYVYPIPPEAVFTNFSLFMGEDELRGEMLPADRARSIYEEIVRRRKDPALIELLGHGMLRARVFPIEPGAERRVILRYTQVLGRDGDMYRLRYPRVVPLVGDEPREVSVIDVRSRAPHPFTMTVRITGAEIFATPYSPTHAIEVRERRDGELEIAHRGGGAARDFELFLPLRESLVGASLLAHAPGSEDGYFMLLLTPPAVSDEVQIPRDVTLVLDVSGSMSGGKMEQARAALDQILAGLRPEDRFRLITFSSYVRTFSDDFVNADAETLREARDYLAGVRAEGSTNVMDALQEALQPETTGGRLSMIVFLTDGKPTVGETEPERIADTAEQLRDGERVFAFGVGYDVNTYLLDRMADGGRGSVSYVRPGEDVEEAVSSLTRKISFPALADLRIVDAPADLEDFYPNPLPDLFYGEELVLFGRYRGDGRGELVLEGTRGGETERFTYRAELPRRENDNDFIPRLWAARKAGALTAQIRLNGPDRELIEEIRQLGLRYGILTEYTSYLVEEPQFAVLDTDEIMERGIVPAAAMAPEEQVGAEAFDAAQRSSRMREAKQATDAEAENLALAASSVGRADGSRDAAERVRHVGRRLFVLRDGSWTDIGYNDSLEVVEIASYSKAYFELLDRIPALAEYFALGEELVIGGDGVALRLTADGATDLSSKDLRAVLEGFEGSL
jgi:Ca-activated chloride channel family protein